MSQLNEYLHKITAERPARIILSCPSPSCQYKKITISDKQSSYQSEMLTGKQAFHETVAADTLHAYLLAQMEQFSQLNSFHSGYECSVRITKKGKPLFLKQKSQNNFTAEQSHNREKNYILREGDAIPPLVDMGIFTKEGKVAAPMYDKFKQLNRFIETVEDTLGDNPPQQLNVIDFGCGKSYLTFVLYHYFKFIKGIDIRMTGLDLKADVIEKCSAAATKYGYDNLSFRVGDIQGFSSTDNVDMVITLHACDTATDYALYHAIKANARIILSVPCCQHELNAQIKSERLSILTRYGIIKEHIASALTDAIRANLLTCCGYKSQLLEYVDYTHTPKNILIRATKANIPHATKQKALAEIKNTLDEFSINPKLYELLQNEINKDKEQR